MIAQNPLHPQTLMAAMQHFSDPEVCESYLASVKWPNGPACPKCGSSNIAHIKSRNRYQCRSCRKQCSLKTGTIFESSPLSLSQWFVGIWMITNCRNGVSSCEIARTLGIKQQSAWHLLHRVRAAMKPEFQRRLQGTVEADETFVGGRAKFMHKSRRWKAICPSWKGKTIVQAFLERNGEARGMVIKRADKRHMMPNIQKHVEPGTKIYSDEFLVYKFMGPDYAHEFVNHMQQYVKDGVIHTNGLENYFSCLRRTLKGTYVAVDPEHLEAYVDEQTYRFNVRHESEWERFSRAVRWGIGRTLQYSELTNGCTR